MKKFRIAREGATTDGRNISRAWIEQMAKNYNPKEYGARINLEHFKGVLPDGPFRAYGDVVALSTEEHNGKLCLIGELDPTDDLVELSKKRQKVYCSIEVDPDFADTGEAYLVGLAVTDTPATLGAEMLKFSASASANPLAARKQSPRNLFSAAEFELDFSGHEPSEPETSLVDTVKQLFSKHRKASTTQFADFKRDLEEAMGCLVEKVSELDEQVRAVTAADNDQKFAQLKADFDQLKSALDSTPGNHYQRTTATGGDNTIQTDC
ncbi:GPO family capsid scaffolding protein [Marinimicrobium sp. ARAG 43.8]|uniref:GPO family capsid scaffolding protein n=1 Tax=Marinimicrobium sp. ARAG 43.8 TaxID=3418719 RepID=UPI003CF8C99D